MTQASYAYNEYADDIHDEEDPEQVFTINKADIPSLVTGENVLAIEIHNCTGSSSDACIVPRLTAARNRPPDLSAIPDAITKNEGTTINAAEVERATDPDGDPLTYTYSNWLTALPYTATSNDIGDHTLHMEVSDGTDATAKDIAVSVSELSPVAAPYTLAITTTHGSVAVSPAKALYDEGETVELIPRPDVGYCFTGWSGDANEKSLVLDLTMDSNKAVAANFRTWIPPIGIPTPEFGIRETYRIYDVPANRNPALTYSQNAEGGYYTHYVDSNDPDATDTSNPYGTVATPRKTIPFTVTEGSVVEIHHALAYNEYGSYVNGAGTVDRPIRARGKSAQIGSLLVDVSVGGLPVRDRGRHQCFGGENLGTGRAPVFDTSHVAVRNCDFYGDRDRGGFGVVSYSANWITDVVLYGNTFHDNGIWILAQPKGIEMSERPLSAKEPGMCGSSIMSSIMSNRPESLSRQEIRNLRS